MKNLVIGVLIILLIGAGFYIWHNKSSNQNNLQNNMQNNSTNISDSSDKKNVDALTTTDVSSISEREVNYYKDVNGFYVEPNMTSRLGVQDYPGVVMIHEWWGLNDEVKQMARNLAKEGYRVLAVDLYNGKVAKDSSEATKLVQSVTVADSNANMQAAVQYLRSQGSTKIASLGWCFGGGKSLQLGLSGEKLNAIVLYYGTPLVTDKNELAKLPAPVLGIFGDKDISIPVDTVNDFQAGLITNDIKNEIEIYTGVGHAFANPSGTNYAPAATKDAWSKTLKFLADNLK